MNVTTFSAGLSAVASAADVDTLDRVRRSIDGHAADGRLTADQAGALAAVARARALELSAAPAAALAPAAMAPAASAPARPAAAAGVPEGFRPGDYGATIAAASEREWPDSGLVLSVSLAAEIAGEPVEVRCRFDANREVARKAMFRAAGLPSGATVEQLIGKPVRVALNVWSPANGGAARLTVRRWHAPAGSTTRSTASATPGVVKFKAPPKPPAPARPAWEADDGIPF